MNVKRLLVIVILAGVGTALYCNVLRPKGAPGALSA